MYKIHKEEDRGQGEMRKRVWERRKVWNIHVVVVYVQYTLTCTCTCKYSKVPTICPHPSICPPSLYFHQGCVCMGLILQVAGICPPPPVIFTCLVHREGMYWWYFTVYIVHVYLETQEHTNTHHWNHHNADLSTCRSSPPWDTDSAAKSLVPRLDFKKIWGQRSYVLGTRNAQPYEHPRK